MGIFKSFLKGQKLASLQRKYSSASQTYLDDLKSSLSEGKWESKSSKVLEEYLLFCMEDPNIKEIMATYSLTTKNLEELFWTFEKAGLGQYVKGHYASMSTLAYAEPLEYSVVRLLKEQAPFQEVCHNLMAYWSAQLPMGALFQKIASSKEFKKRAS